MGVTDKLLSEVLESYKKLGALEKITDGIADKQQHIEDKLGNIIERITRLESDFKHVKSGMRNEIIAELGMQMAAIQAKLNGYDAKQIAGQDKKNKLAE